jgi:LuxR family transcriptional regulator, maltose regulon positive regulatory protein
MPKADPLIRTKLRLPFTRPNLVPRPGLQTRIAVGLHCPLTLVIAPAGFGKTTLVASCVIGCGMPVAWLSLDRGDNQTGRFLSYLIAALHGADDRIGVEAAQLMAGMQPASPEAVLTSLINDLDSANEEMVLVLDDYQFISSQAVHSDVAFLLEHCPLTFHLFIATRSDPPLPLARLRARGQMIELRAADLCFSETEAGQFLNEVMGLRLDKKAVEVLAERTEGWVAGLQMAALSMRDRQDVHSFIERFSGTNRHILDYLMEEILACQSPEIQRFLLYNSILERVSAPLCDALLENGEPSELDDADGQPHLKLPAHTQSASILEYLERENLFLVSLDDERIWFRFHHLFADLLKARLHQVHPDTVPLLHKRASAWLEQKGFIPEAIQHLIAAHEIGKAADLIERYGPVRWAESDLSVVQMADSLPREMVIARPKIGLYKVWLLINQGHIDKALPLMNDMARQLGGADLNPGQQWILTIIRLALAFLGQRAKNLEYDSLPDYQAVEEIPADELILRDAADILYGMTLGRRGEFDRAVEFSVKSIHRKKISRGTSAIPTLVPFLATIYLFQGRLHSAASLCREYLDPIKEKGIRISTAGNMDVVLGEVLYEWNRLEEAEKHIRDGLQANEPWKNIMTDAFGLLALTYVLQGKGDYAGARQVVERFETRLQSLSRPVEFAEDYRTLRVRVQLASGDLQQTFQWADQIQLSEDYRLHKEYYWLTLARIRLAQGRYAEVEEMLAGMPFLDLAGNRITRQIECNLLLAAAIAGQQRLPEAFDLLESCLSLAEPEGYIRVFIGTGEHTRELLAAYLRITAPRHKLYAQKVLGAFSSLGGTAAPCLQPAGLVEPLSGRELEVLQLMALGRTNQDIARQLVVASGTVKAHAASIYRKLDAANRTEAVARARQLGILR